MADEEKTQEIKLQGQTEVNNRCYCERCGKTLSSLQFYTYKDGSKCEICKQCLTAHIDNFDPTTYEWILAKMDVPYIPVEWNVLRDKAFAKNPYKMNGMSVIGKYLAKMKLKQWSSFGYNDSAQILAEMAEKEAKKEQAAKEEKQRYEAELKVKLSEGKISQAEYKTLVSTETQRQELPEIKANLVTGEILTKAKKKKGKKEDIAITTDEPSSYEEALSQVKNPFQEQNFISEDDIPDAGAGLTDDDKIYLAIKWGRLYRPAQWVALEQLYNEFMQSFDIQGAARIDTLKKICKTSLKMDEAMDCGDIDSFQKLSRVYDSLMKSAKFTEAQNKQKQSNTIDSASALVNFVETNSGQIPRYKCDEPQDIVDRIIKDLKDYTRNLIYDDKSLAQEIEKYLQQKTISEEMKKDKKEARAQGKDQRELEDDDFALFQQKQRLMKVHDEDLSDEIIEEEYKEKQVKKADGQ